MITLNVTIPEAEALLSALQSISSYDDEEHLLECKGLEKTLEEEIKLALSPDPATL
jgi:hypothetical protein